MTKLDELDVVVLKKALPGTSVHVGCQRTIVHVHDAGAQAYEVEFMDERYKTIDVCSVIGDEYLELKFAHREMK